MTTLDEHTTIRTGVDVPVPPDRAFELFAVGMDRWWNREHYVQSSPLARIGVDPFVGGRLYEESVDGEICVWGRVLNWEPGRLFAFSWLIGPAWAPPAPDSPGSRVTVTFTPSDAGTRIELVHTDLDIHGPGWEGVRGALGDEHGWAGGLRRTAELATVR